MLNLKFNDTLDHQGKWDVVVHPDSHLFAMISSGLRLAIFSSSLDRPPHVVLFENPLTCVKGNAAWIVVCDTTGNIFGLSWAGEIHWRFNLGHNVATVALVAPLDTLCDADVDVVAMTSESLSFFSSKSRIPVCNVITYENGSAFDARDQRAVVAASEGVFFLNLAAPEENFMFATSSRATAAVVRENSYAFGFNDGSLFASSENNVWKLCESHRGAVVKMSAREAWMLSFGNDIILLKDDSLHLRLNIEQVRDCSIVSCTEFAVLSHENLKIFSFDGWVTRVLCCSQGKAFAVCPSRFAVVMCGEGSARVWKLESGPEREVTSASPTRVSRTVNGNKVVVQFCVDERSRGLDEVWSC